MFVRSSFIYSPSKFWYVISLINSLEVSLFVGKEQKVKSIKNKMIKNISKLCEISKNQINIKGKTTEKLGLIGKEKAIACEVISSVTKYE